MKALKTLELIQAYSLCLQWHFQKNAFSKSLKYSFEIKTFIN